MRYRSPHACLLAAALLTGCTNVSIDTAWAQRAEGIEAQVDAGGNLTEVEYHIRPDEVPQAVRDAMMALYPDGAFTGAEYEIDHGRVYYELTTSTGGRDIEAMFTPEGELHSMEIEVEHSAAPAVTDAVRRTWPDCTLRALEEIRDGNRDLVEYHVKIESGGMNYKVMVDLDGTIRGAVRETPAELEVPVSVPMR